jgi:hypothetical protein
VPTIGARLDSRQFEVLVDVIQNIAMAPLPMVRGGESPDAGCTRSLPSAALLAASCLGSLCLVSLTPRALLRARACVLRSSRWRCAPCGSTRTASARTTTTRMCSTRWRRCSRCASASAASRRSSWPCCRRSSSTRCGSSGSKRTPG